MKKILLLCAVLLLTGFSLASGEGGQPSLKSQEAPDAGLFRRNGNSIGVSVSSENFPDIVLHLSVFDSGGNPLPGLSQEDFFLTEQSAAEAFPIAQTLTCFAESSDSNSISIALVFDISESMDMENRLADAKTAAKNFFNTTQSGDRASLVTFSGCNQGGIIQEVDEIGTDSNSNGVSDIAEAVSGLTTIGRTAVYDGIGMGIESIEAENFPRGVMVFTDGESNHDCLFDINQVIQKARDAGIPIYTIGLQSGMYSRLELIAQETGGYYREAPTAADMEEIYRHIADSIRGQYTLCYSSHNPSLDGTERTVTVTQGENIGSGRYTVDGTPDDNPPVLTHSPVSEWRENTPLPVNAAASDTDEADRTVSVLLYYRVAGNDPTAVYTPIQMVQESGDSYTAEIPADILTGSGLEYYLTACNNRQICSSSGTAQHPHPVTVYANQPPVIRHSPLTEGEENMSIDIGAQISDPDDGDSIRDAVLYFRISGAGGYSEISLDKSSGDSYTGQIPGDQVTTAGLDYYIAAWDKRDAETQNGSADSPHRITVTEAEENQPPLANAGKDQSVSEGGTVLLDGSGSSGAGSLIYSWHQVSGNSAELSDPAVPSPEFTAPATGPEGSILVFELTVTDSTGLAATDRVSIRVNDALSPRAAFTWEPVSPAPDDAVSFADRSVPQSGEIVSWEWDFGGLGSDTARHPVFSFTESGIYEIRLTVRDENGSAAAIVKTLTVSCPGEDCEGNDDEAEEPCAGGDCGGGSGGCFIQSVSESVFCRPFPGPFSNNRR
ncbi:MAG: PKD domain-containing protein [Desulfococcaceae bacterium]|jgi:VWFA-related protein|nr:PKD domain-containing protein [Desulfococcaceae bacterium]